MKAVNISKFDHRTPELIAKAMSDDLSNLDKYKIVEKQTHHLSVVGDYVDWNYWECVREILQNFIDASRGEHGVYRISRGKAHFYNENAVLERESLLIGVSSKREDEGAIGHFGEGYKLAIARLCNLYGNCCKVVVDHNNVRELWTFSLRPSPIAENRQVLAVDLTTVESEEDFGLGTHFIVPADNAEQWKVMQDNCLYLQSGPDGELFRHDLTTIVLLDKKNAGKVFCKGLFVRSFENSYFGYNLHGVNLDRDRRRINDWELEAAVGKAWRRLAVSAGLSKADFYCTAHKIPEGCCDLVAKRFIEHAERDVLAWNTVYTNDAARSAALFVDAYWEKTHPEFFLPVEFSEAQIRLFRKHGLAFSPTVLPGYSTFKLETEKYRNVVDELLLKKVHAEEDIERLTEINAHILQKLSAGCLTDMPNETVSVVDHIRHGSRTAKVLLEDVQVFVIPDMDVIIKIQNMQNPEGEAERSTGGLFVRNEDGSQFIIVSEKHFRDNPQHILGCLVHEIAHAYSMSHDLEHANMMNRIFEELLDNEGFFTSLNLDW